MSVLVKEITNGEYDLEGGRWAEISEPAKDLVRGLLNVDAVARLNC